MNLTGYVEALQQQLAVAAATGGDEAQALAGRLVAPLDAATRLVLLDALSAAAGEITREMAPGSVDLRLPEQLKGRVEDAASQAGLSVNAWLVRAATAALNGSGDQNARGPREDRRAPRGGQRFTGWVR